MIAKMLERLQDGPFYSFPLRRFASDTGYFVPLPGAVLAKKELPLSAEEFTAFVTAYQQANLLALDHATTYLRIYPNGRYVVAGMYVHFNSLSAARAYNRAHNQSFIFDLKNDKPTK